LVVASPFVARPVLAVTIEMKAQTINGAGLIVEMIGIIVLMKPGTLLKNRDSEHLGCGL